MKCPTDWLDNDPTVIQSPNDASLIFLGEEIFTIGCWFCEGLTANNCRNRVCRAESVMFEERAQRANTFQKILPQFVASSVFVLFLNLKVTEFTL